MINIGSVNILISQKSWDAGACLPTPEIFFPKPVQVPQ